MYKYTELMGQDFNTLDGTISQLFKDADIGRDLSELKQDKRLQVQQNQITALREALTLIFSRPDKDNLSLKLLPKVRDQLKDLQIYEETLLGLSDDALRAISNKELKPIYRATQFFILENIMAEARPDINTHPSIKKLFVSIRDKNVRVDNDVKSLRNKRGFFKTRSPSKVAAAILEKQSSTQTKLKANTLISEK